MRWQDVKDLGLNLFKKMSRSRTLWIGSSTSIFAFFAYILLLTGVSETNSGDSDCIYNETSGLDRCESYFNITTTYWRFCFEESFEFIDTNPKIETTLYVPTYGKKWRLFNPAKDCIERKSKYIYLPNRFKIVGYKEFDQTVKWSFSFNQFNGRINVDPIWRGINITKICDWRIEQKEKTRYYSSFNLNNYTCPSNNYYVSNNIDGKIGYCYEDIEVWNESNQTWVYPLIKSHRYDSIIPPKTIQWITEDRTYYIDYINTTVCDLQGYQINNFKVNFSLCNMFCVRDGKIVTCDSTIDGNGDGILQSGESGFSFDITKVNWKKFKKKIDSVKYTKLRECIVKT